MWRKPSRPVIEKVIRDFQIAEEAHMTATGGLVGKYQNVAEREKALKAALDAAYPWADTYGKPATVRRVWLDEIKRVRGIKPPLWSPAKELERVARLLAANEDKYGTPESKRRLLGTLAWVPGERGSNG